MCQTIVKFVFCIVICAFFSESFSYLNEKPNFLKDPCDFTGSQVNECTAEKVQTIFNKLSTVGISGLEESVGIIEPLRLERVRVISGDNGPVGINATLKKVVIHGFKDVQILENVYSQKPKINKVTWNTILFLPKLKFDSQLRVVGRILLIPLNGNGKFNFEARNMKIKLRTLSHLYQRDDYTFYNVTSTRVTFTVSGLKLRIDNLFNGARNLEESTNIFFNQNWEVALDALRPIITKTIEDILLDLMTKVFHHIPGEWLMSNLPEVDFKLV